VAIIGAHMQFQLPITRRLLNSQSRAKRHIRDMANPLHLWLMERLRELVTEWSGCSGNLTTADLCWWQSTEFLGSRLVETEPGLLGMLARFGL